MTLDGLLSALAAAALRRVTTQAGTVARADIDELSITLDDGSAIDGVRYANPAGMRARPRVGARCLIQWDFAGPYACEWESNAFADLALNEGTRPVARDNDLVKFDLGDPLGYTLVGVVATSNQPAVPVGATVILMPVLVTGEVKGQITASQQVVRA